jgi:F420-0:gamma-glutamyl ligase
VLVSWKLSTAPIGALCTADKIEAGLANAAELRVSIGISLIVTDVDKRATVTGNCGVAIYFSYLL